MKFLAFVDLHENAKYLKELVSRAKEDDIEFVVCAGDLSNFGRGLTRALKEFNALGKKLYLIPGNHEDNLDLDRVVKEYPNCFNFHKKTFRLGGYLFLGYGGDGFAAQDPEFRKIAREWYGRHKGEKIVLVTHGPPFSTAIDILPGGHSGNKDYRSFIERVEPKLVICGHLHETAGTVDKIGKTKVINPGWEGMVIELN